MNDDDEDEAEGALPNFSELRLFVAPERRSMCFMKPLDVALSRELRGGVPWKLPPRLGYMPSARSLSEDTGSP